MIKAKAKAPKKKGNENIILGKSHKKKTTK